MRSFRDRFLANRKEARTMTASRKVISGELKSVSTSPAGLTPRPIPLRPNMA